MSRNPSWRCACTREVGRIRWRNGSSLLQLARAVEEVLIGPSTAAVICPACGSAVYFVSREAGDFTTALGTAAS